MSLRERLNSKGKDEDHVTCIACGDAVLRSSAREYDKYGNRWERNGKQFEYMCKPCHQECCHQYREGLESRLIKAGAGITDRASFLSRYYDIVTDTSKEQQSDPNQS